MTNLHLYTLLAIIAALCVALWRLSTSEPVDPTVAEKHDCDCRICHGNRNG